MKKILVLGAGRSSSSLINYLLKTAEQFKWSVTVGDASLEQAQQKVLGSNFGTPILFNVNNEVQRSELISTHDLVISLMPPPFHFTVAKTCLQHGKHLLTASYVSPEIATLDLEAKQKNILILMETGLDPGIDHMSSLVEIRRIEKAGGSLSSFKSFTGGLMAPESDNNPWNYKITWNPRNVVLAGKGVSKFLENGIVKEVDYKNLFKTTEKFQVKGYGTFEGYPNRDSLKYLETYKLNGLSTFLRGTLRRPGYCSAWNVLVQAGFTDDETIISNSSELTYKQIAELILQPLAGRSIHEKLNKLGSADDIEKLEWLGILSNVKTNIPNAAPADLLQKLMEEKWKLQSGDKDMIVMQHQFEYKISEQKKRLTSSLVVKGEDEWETAMAKTVGLPLGIAARLLLENKIKSTGVQIPVLEELYIPILKELEELGVRFVHDEISI